MKRISLLFLLVVLACSSVWAATIKVPEDHVTVQIGINAAVDDDTVLVGEGAYSIAGSLEIKPSISLIGSGSNKSTLEIEEGVRAKDLDYLAI